MAAGSSTRPATAIAGAALLGACASAVLGMAVSLTVVTALLGGATRSVDCPAAGDPADPAAPLPGNLGAVAGTGITRGELAVVRTHARGDKVTTGTFGATSYGPPWGGIQGAGVATAGGLRLNGGAPRKYFVAVDPAVISLGSWISAWPNPFGWRGAFLAADTGGAIRGRRIDFYDWRGRAFQLRWNRTVHVSRPTSAPLGEIPRLLNDDGSTATAPPTAGTQTAPLPSTGGSCRQTLSGSGDASAVLAAAEALAAMRVPYNYGGGHVTPARPTHGSDGPFDGLDCSSAVSWVLQHAGIDVGTMVSGAFMSWGERGPGRAVTLYANPGHIFMSIRVGDRLRFFGTNGGEGPQFFAAPSAGYVARFEQRHPPGL